MPCRSRKTPRTTKRTHEHRTAEGEAYARLASSSSLPSPHLPEVRDERGRSARVLGLVPQVPRPAQDGRGIDMMMRLRSVCAEPGCPNLSVPRDSRCQVHKRGTAAQRGYDSRWNRRRAAFLARHPTCVECGQPSTDADHDPIDRRDLVAMGIEDPDQEQYLQAKCGRCHKRRTRMQAQGA